MHMSPHYTLAHSQQLSSKLSRKLINYTLLVSPPAPDGAIFARLYSSSNNRALTISFDAQTIHKDDYIRERLSTIS